MAQPRGPVVWATPSHMRPWGCRCQRRWLLEGLAVAHLVDAVVAITVSSGGRPEGAGLTGGAGSFSRGDVQGPSPEGTWEPAGKGPQAPRISQPPGRLQQREPCEKSGSACFLGNGPFPSPSLVRPQRQVCGEAVPAVGGLCLGGGQLPQVAEGQVVPGRQRLGFQQERPARMPLEVGGLFFNLHLPPL